MQIASLLPHCVDCIPGTTLLTLPLHPSTANIRHTVSIPTLQSLTPQHTIRHTLVRPAALSPYCSPYLPLKQPAAHCMQHMILSDLQHHHHTSHLTIASLCRQCKTHSLYPQTAQPDTAAACSTLYATHWSDLQSMQFSCLPVMGVRYWKIQ